MVNDFFNLCCGLLGMYSLVMYVVLFYSVYKTYFDRSIDDGELTDNSE